QLLVEPVPQPSDRLCEQDSRREGIGECGEADARPPASEPGADPAADEGAVNGDPALPDVEDRPDIGAGTEVEAPVRDHVVDACTDDRQGYGDQTDVDHDPGLASAPSESVIGHEDRDDDAHEDAQRIEMDREGSDRERTDRRAGNTGHDT